MLRSISPQSSVQSFYRRYLPEWTTLKRGWRTPLERAIKRPERAAERRLSAPFALVFLFALLIATDRKKQKLSRGFLLVCVQYVSLAPPPFIVDHVNQQ